MQQVIKQRRYIIAAALLGLAVFAAIAFAVITARAQCAPNDLNCMNLP